MLSHLRHNSRLVRSFGQLLGPAPCYREENWPLQLVKYLVKIHSASAEVDLELRSYHSEFHGLCTVPPWALISSLPSLVYSFHSVWSALWCTDLGARCVWLHQMMGDTSSGSCCHGTHYWHTTHTASQHTHHNTHHCIACEKSWFLVLKEQAYWLLFPQVNFFFFFFFWLWHGAYGILVSQPVVEPMPHTVEVLLDC